MKYAGIESRFSAGLIDFCVFLPFIALHVWASASSLRAQVVATIVSAFLYPGYSIYFHGRFGQTIGKMVMKIRVISYNGTRLAWRQACYRSSVDVVLSLLQTLTFLIAASRVTAVDFASLNWIERAQRIKQLTPYTWELTVLANVWVWSEVIIILTNKRRRALHDFIAGSVVVYDEP